MPQVAQATFTATDIAAHIFKAMQTTMENLYGRWLDEREYEDFAEYEKVMRDVLASNITAAFAPYCKFTKGTKRPFGFVVQIGSHSISFSINTRSYSYGKTK